MWSNDLSTGQTSPWSANGWTTITVQDGTGTGYWQPVQTPTSWPDLPFPKVTIGSHTIPTPVPAWKTKAQRSRELAKQMASDALFGQQPRNNHHRSLRDYSDAPRRPCHRGTR